MKIFTVIEYPMEGLFTGSVMVFAPWLKAFTSEKKAQEAVVEHVSGLLKAQGELSSVVAFAQNGVPWYPVDHR